MRIKTKLKKKYIYKIKIKLIHEIIIIKNLRKV